MFFNMLRAVPTLERCNALPLETQQVAPHIMDTPGANHGPRRLICPCPMMGRTPNHRFERMTMRGFDFAPLYRATVGFDRIADLMDRTLTADVAQPTYPPYNIEKTANDAYRISIAVAGFTPDELTVEVKDGSLFVLARKAADDTEKAYLHRGIATRAFEPALPWPTTSA
jgi:HSP20 family molecular chaperone IbpA